MIRLFVGYDAEQALAPQVFAHSVIRRASVPVSVHYLMLSQLRAFFNREADPYQSTEFAFSRFLVPFLCAFEGWAMFADGDMICLADLAELWAMRDDALAVQVVKRTHHEMTPSGKKFLGKTQSAYQRKNWSSVMLFNNARCKTLTPEYVEKAAGLDLHQFAWTQHDDEVGPLPSAWNHLVGVDVHDPHAKLVHFTVAMPYFNGWRECEYAPQWREERDAMLAYRGG